MQYLFKQNKQQLWTLDWYQLVMIENSFLAIFLRTIPSQILISVYDSSQVFWKAIPDSLLAIADLFQLILKFFIFWPFCDWPTISSEWYATVSLMERSANRPMRYFRSDLEAAAVTFQNSGAPSVTIDHYMIIPNPVIKYQVRTSL